MDLRKVLPRVTPGAHETLKLRTQKYAQPLSLCPKFVAVSADPEGPFQLFAALSTVASQTKYISTDPPPPRYLPQGNQYDISLQT